MLQILPNFLAKPITALYNISLQSGEVPHDWRKAIICPIFKKGDPEDGANYRPVSLPSALCKIFEKLLKKALLLFLTETRSLSRSKHGFLQGERVNRLLYEGYTVDLVYLDFAKAFYSVYHRFIVANLNFSCNVENN